MGVTSQCLICHEDIRQKALCKGSRTPKKLALPIVKLIADLAFRISDRTEMILTHTSQGVQAQFVSIETHLQWRDGVAGYVYSAAEWLWNESLKRYLVLWQGPHRESIYDACDDLREHEGHAQSSALERAGIVGKKPD